MTKKRTRVKGGDAQRGRAAKILRERLRGDGKLVTSTPSGDRKISEVLLEFSDPLLDVFRREGRVTKRDFQLVLQLTSLLWNAALLPNGS